MYNEPSPNTANVFTDGSCHPQKKIGAWVAIILIENEKLTFSGTELNTTHNRMELIAVIKAVDHLKQQYPFIKTINIISDSQYVVDLLSRKEKLLNLEFATKKGTALFNADLIKELYSNADLLSLTFNKIKAHQKKNEIINYNIEADKLSRKLVRSMVNQIT